MYDPTPVIAIVGRRRDTGNYEAALARLSAGFKTTLKPSEIHSCDALLLPGGGDITPAFFGQKNNGSANIDTELDILQLQALELSVKQKKPVLGICKGMQLINVFFGGTIIQDMKERDSHRYAGHDQLHDTVIPPDSFLFPLYGGSMTVNSAHHQCVDRLGKELLLAQYALPSPTPEAVRHRLLPVFGVQWHPERFSPSGDVLLSFFLSLASRRDPSVCVRPPVTNTCGGSGFF